MKIVELYFVETSVRQTYKEWTTRLHKNTQGDGLLRSSTFEIKDIVEVDSLYITAKTGNKATDEEMKSGDYWNRMDF